MCIPCGPKGYGAPGRIPYVTMDEIKQFSLEGAKKKYPNLDEAMHKAFLVIEKNPSHTEKWMLNEIYENDRALARIVVEPENLKVFRKKLREVKGKK